jgi:hypothetical protein
MQSETKLVLPQKLDGFFKAVTGYCTLNTINIFTTFDIIIIIIIIIIITLLFSLFMLLSLSRDFPSLHVLLIYKWFLILM